MFPLELRVRTAPFSLRLSFSALSFSLQTLDYQPSLEEQCSQQHQHTYTRLRGGSYKTRSSSPNIPTSVQEFLCYALSAEEPISMARMKHSHPTGPFFAQPQASL